MSDDNEWKKASTEEKCEHKVSELNLYQCVKIK